MLSFDGVRFGGGRRAFRPGAWGFLCVGGDSGEAWGRPLQGQSTRQGRPPPKRPAPKRQARVTLKPYAKCRLRSAPSDRPGAEWSRR